jgi:hypothetical protein
MEDVYSSLLFLLYFGALVARAAILLQGVDFLDFYIGILSGGSKHQTK